MRFRSRIGAALVLALIAGPGAAVGHASTTNGSSSGVTLYVNGSNSSSCSDQGSGTLAVPFCTVQKAFNVVTAGETVDVESNSGIAGTPLTLSASGTATAPITVNFTNNTLVLLSASQGPAITFSGANYVQLENFSVTDPSTTAPAIAVQHSGNVTLNSGQVMGDGTGVEISGASSADAVERVSFEVQGTGVAVDSGVSNAVVTTDSFLGTTNTGLGVAVTGATGTDVVSNTMDTECVAGISVSGGAHSTAIENNVIGIYGSGAESSPCSTTLSSALGVAVSGDSTSGTVEKYDTFDAYQNSPVSWSGTSYTSLSAYQSASGQGSHDVFTIGSTEGRPAASEYVDGADALAPGELSTDITGRGRVDDPQVPNTGTGVGYYDRGAEELQDDFYTDFLNAGAHPTTARGAEVVYDVTSCYSWGSTYTVTVTWGDGQSSQTSGTAASTCGGQGATFEHTYAKPGTYTITLTGTDGYTPVTHTATVGTLGLDYTAANPTRVLDTRSGLGAPKGKVAQNAYVKVKVAGTGSIPADVQAVAINLTVTDTTGGGLVAALSTNPNAQSNPLPNLFYSSGQTLANSAIVPVGADGDIEVYNYSGTSSIDAIVDVTGYFTRTAASGYAPVPLDRILDTRKGLGAPQGQLAGGHSLSLGIAGVDSIPSNATAVAVHLTAVNGTGSGAISAAADGSGTPTTSSLNFGKGQAVSNTVIVPIAADGKIQLNDYGASSVDVLADVSGYFTASATTTLSLVTPFRELDTQYGGQGPMKPDTAYVFPDMQHAVDAVAVVTNLTANTPTANGDLVAYPVGTTRPTVSDVNFAAGQTTANLAILPNPDPNSAAQITVYNDSAGSTNLLIDLVGYFTNQ